MSYSISRTPTHVLTRELDRLVHQGELRTYRVKRASGKRRFVLSWQDGSVQDVGVAALDGILNALAQRRAEESA